MNAIPIRIIAAALLIGLMLAAPVVGAPPEIPDDMPKGVRIQVEKLGSPDREVRARALVVLWSMHDRAAPAAPWVAPLLGDEEPVKLGGRVGTRSCANIAEQVLRDAGSRALPALRTVVGHGSAAVRKRVAVLLGRIRDPGAIGPLVVLAGDADGDVRRAAIGGLQTREDARVFPVALEATRSKDPEIRRLGLGLLAGQESPEVGKVLLAGLKDPDEGVRVAAIQALGHRKEAGLLEILRPFCENGSVKERRAAVSVLANALPIRSMALMLVAVGDNDEQVRAAAVFGLGRSEDEAAADAVVAAAARDPSAMVRVQAVRALAILPVARTTPALVAALRDPDEGVRTAALSVLAAPDHPPIMETSALEPLLGMTRDRSVMVRVQAIQALAKLALDEPDGRIVGTLIGATRDGTQSVRTNALRGLANRGEPEALRALIEAAKHRDRVTRRTALEALGTSNDPAACEVLIAAARDDDRSVRKTALEALGNQSDPRAIGLIVEALANPQLRATAIASLGRQDSDEAVRILVKLLSSENDMFTRTGALRALGGMDVPNSSDAILAMLNEKDPNLRSTAIELVKRRKEIRSVPALIEMLPDKRFGRMAYEALKKITGEDFGRIPDPWRDWVENW